PEGQIRRVQEPGHAIPEGGNIDHQGRRAPSAAALYGPPRGALLPFGGHKGFGLSMLIDALAGGLSGAGCCTDANTPMGGKTDGVFLVVVKIAAFYPLLEFQRNIGRLVHHVKSSPPAPGLPEVLVPGELEAKTKRHRLCEG